MDPRTTKRVSPSKIKHKRATYILPGSPIPCARPRFGHRRVFDSQKLLKINHGLLIGHIHGNRPLYTGPLKLNAIFYVAVPQPLTAKKSKLYGTYRDKRPDLDNYIKYILDVSNNVLYTDDALIAVVHAKKIYDPKPRTEFTITELTNETQKP